MEESPFTGSLIIGKKHVHLAANNATSLCCVVHKWIEYKLNFMFFIGAFQELGTFDDYVTFDLNIFFSQTDISLIIFLKNFINFARLTMEPYRIFPNAASNNCRNINSA